MEGTIQLFGRGSLYDGTHLLSNSLDATERSAIDRLQKWDADELLSTPTETIVAHLVEGGSVVCPNLLIDEVWQKPPTEVSQQFVEFGETLTRRVTRLVLVLPYEGEREVFTLRANTSSTNPPRVLRLDQGELHLAIDNPPADAAAVRAQFDEQIANIDKYLGWSRLQIEEHNQRLRDEIPGLVESRREQLLAIRKLQADTGYPTSRPSSK